MKTYITEPPAVSQPPLKFPLLARTVYTGLVVLFRGERSGTVLVGSNAAYPVGYAYEGWEEVSNTEFWQILPPGTKVTLEQEAVS